MRTITVEISDAMYEAAKRMNKVMPARFLDGKPMDLSPEDYIRNRIQHLCRGFVAFHGMKETEHCIHD